MIWPATTHRSNWSTFPTPGWHYACSKSGYTDSFISLQWLKFVYDPQNKERANQEPRVLICDGFGAHKFLEILEFCLMNNILLCRIPSYTSHKLQLCDIGVFAPLKTAYRDQVERLERGAVNHFTALYSPARDKAFTKKKNIASAWAASGLFPFNPDTVLRQTPKPPAEPPIPDTRVCKSGIGPYPQGEVRQAPSTSESLTSYKLNPDQRRCSSR
ncbi:DDE-domain-containing protein [Viridothelium virens]|uniref:DDE-domain-containing protein n=1 Tax=Viridothelium virens TaxID=1048519 RepID=A0A6A6GTH2_VIRVR|nr:DDE-domain-containing protein [Viridothelium virens]